MMNVGEVKIISVYSRQAEGGGTFILLIGLRESILLNNLYIIKQYTVNRVQLLPFPNIRET